MKKIAAPRPLKRSGVIPTTRSKFARAEMYFRDDEEAGRNDHEELFGGDMAAVEEAVGVRASYRIATTLDDESIEMEGSCEIQRIFLSGLHTPGPRGANDDDDDDSESRLYFFNDRAPHAQSPSFQFFIPTASRYHGGFQHGDEDEVTYDLSSDFPLLGHSPNHKSNSGDEDEHAYFDSFHFPISRAANPMPLNTPFHVPTTNDAPVYAGSLYDNQHVTVGTRGHFYTLPSGGVRPQLKGPDASINWAAGVEDNDPVQLSGETNRTSRNRSYSEPIPFVPAAPARS